MRKNSTLTLPEIFYTGRSTLAQHTFCFHPRDHTFSPIFSPPEDRVHSTQPGLNLGPCGAKHHLRSVRLREPLCHLAMYNPFAAIMQFTTVLQPISLIHTLHMHERMYMHTHTHTHTHHTFREFTYAFNIHSLVHIFTNTLFSQSFSVLMRLSVLYIDFNTYAQACS